MTIGLAEVSRARRALAAVAALLFLVVAPSGAAGDEKEEKPKQKEAVVHVGDDEAKAALERFQVIADSGDEKALAPALERLSDTPHPLVAKEVEKHFSSSRSTDVKLAALRALGRWDEGLSGSALKKAFRSKKNEDNPKLYAAIIEAMTESETKIPAKTLLDLVPIDASRQDVNVQKAAVVALGRMKEKKAVELFIKIWEQDPNAQPANPGPTDPPASYWKAVWERWAAVGEPLKAAMKEITGETFESGKAAREWYRKNKNRLRIP